MNDFIIVAAVVRVVIDVATIAAVCAWALDRELEAGS